MDAPWRDFETVLIDLAHRGPTAAGADLNVHRRDFNDRLRRSPGSKLYKRAGPTTTTLATHASSTTTTHITLGTPARTVSALLEPSCGAW
jgi:hypothetical protein